MAVICSLLLVAVQIQQNTNITGDQTQDSLTQNQIDLLISVVSVGTNEFAADVLRRGATGQLDSSNIEYIAYFILQQANLRVWENELYQYQQGLFDDSEFAARKATWADLLRIPSLRDIWNITKENHSTEFQIVINELLLEGI